MGLRHRKPRLARERPVTATDDVWPAPPGPAEAAHAVDPAPARPPRSGRAPGRRDQVVTSRDGAVLTGRERFQADRNRSWAARRDVLPSSRPSEVEVDRAPAAAAGPPPAGQPSAGAALADLQVNRLEVVRHEVIGPDPRPLPAGSDELDIWPLVLPGKSPVAAPRAAAVLPTQSLRSPPARPRRVGRGSTPEPSPDRVNPIDDLVPRQARPPYGVDLATSADELFPPSTRQPPADLLGRRPAGTSTGMVPKIFAPGHGLDESALPVLVGEPVPEGRPHPGPAPRRLPDLRLPDPRLPVRPRPPVSLGDAVFDLDGPGFWTRGPLDPSDRRHDGGVADLSLLLQAGGEPVPAAAPAPRSGSGRVAHSRREVGRDRHRGTRRGWALPTFTAALGLVAGILYASGGDQAAGLTAAPTPAATVTRPAVTVTITATAPIRYANCAAARRAGVAPLRLGDPGYRKRLDPDGDGVACR